MKKRFRVAFPGVARRVVPEFPRLVMYGDCNGCPSRRGYPFTVSDTYGAAINHAFIEQHMPKYDLFIIQPAIWGGAHYLTGGDAQVGLRLDILDALRAACPGKPILAHFMFRNSGWTNTFDHWLRLLYDTVTSFAGGWQKTAAGIQYPNGDPNEGYINLARRAVHNTSSPWSSGSLVVAEAVAEILVGAYQNTHFGNLAVEGKRRFDGLMTELIQSPESNLGDTAFQQNGYATAAEFKASFSEGARLVAQLVRAGIGDAAHLCGLGAGDGYGNPTGPAEINPNLLANNAVHQGWARENVFAQNGGTWDSNMTARADRPGNAYIPEQALYRKPNLSCLYGLILGVGLGDTDPTTPDSLRRARLGLASAALGEGFFSHGTLEDRIETLSVTWAMPVGFGAREWGAAAGPATKVTAYLSPGVPFGFGWVRQFKRAKVHVNPNGSARIIDDVTVPANDAVAVAA